MVKYFYQGKLEAADVQEFLARERALHNVQTKDNVAEQEVVFLGNSTDAGIAENSSLLSKELKLQSGYLSEESANAYNAIFLRLSEMRIADNKSWQHRTIYRVSHSPASSLHIVVLTLNCFHNFRLHGCIIISIKILKKQSLNY